MEHDEATRKRAQLNTIVYTRLSTHQLRYHTISEFQQFKGTSSCTPGPEWLKFKFVFMKTIFQSRQKLKSNFYATFSTIILRRLCQALNPARIMQSLSKAWQFRFHSKLFKKQIKLETFPTFPLVFHFPPYEK